MTAMEPGPLFEPEAVAFSFQSPGWYVLAALIAGMLIYLSVKGIRNYLKNAYRREALKQLANIEMEPGQGGKDRLTATLVLLKAVAIQAFGRELVAPLHGKNWLTFLEERGKGTGFLEHSSSISAVLYRGERADEKQEREIMALSKRWIKTHA